MQRLDDILLENVQYTSYVKMRYDSNNFIMVGSQVGFIYENANNVNNLFDIKL